jgi:hypothetical protein
MRYAPYELLLTSLSLLAAAGFHRGPSPVLLAFILGGEIRLEDMHLVLASRPHPGPLISSKTYAPGLLLDPGRSTLAVLMLSVPHFGTGFARIHDWNHSHLIHLSGVCAYSIHCTSSVQPRDLLLIPITELVPEIPTGKTIHDLCFEVASYERRWPVVTHLPSTSHWTNGLGNICLVHQTA